MYIKNKQITSIPNVGSITLLLTVYDNAEGALLTNDEC